MSDPASNKVSCILKIITRWTIVTVKYDIFKVKGLDKVISKTDIHRCDFNPIETSRIQCPSEICSCV